MFDRYKNDPDIYVAGPLYNNYSDYQVIVTGNEITSIDNGKPWYAADREVSEEISLYTPGSIDVYKNVHNKDGKVNRQFEVNVNKLVINDSNIDNIIYNKYSIEQVRQFEAQDTKAGKGKHYQMKISCVVHGKLSDFIYIYDHVNNLYRPGNTEKDIVGVVLIPLRLVRGIFKEQKRQHLRYLPCDNWT